MMLTMAIAILLAYFFCLIIDRDTEETLTIGTIAIISLIILDILLKLGIINL